MTQGLSDVLQLLQLRPDEVRIYCAIVEGGPQTARALSRSLGLVRTSLYGTLQRLQALGLLTASRQRGVSLFAAQDPDAIGLLLEERRVALERGQQAYASLLPQLRAQRASQLLRPTFHLIEGEEGMRAILKDMLLYRDLRTEAFWPIRQMLDVLSPAFFRYLNQLRVENHLYTRAIWPQSQAVDIVRYPYLGTGEAFQREIRLAPEGVDCTMGYWIYGQKVVFLSSRKEAFGFTVESAELVGMMRAQFEVLWQQSKPLSSRTPSSAAMKKR
jgi:DNA-binding transcriptional ArsR family regulator